MLAELEQDIRGRLAEATLTELELTEEVSEIRQSLRDALSELSTRSQSENSVRLNNWITNASMEVAIQLTQVLDCKSEKERRPGSLTGVHSDVATEIDRPYTTPPFVSVPNPTSLNQPSMNYAQYSLQSNAQPQAESTNLVSLMAQQIATPKPNSCFTVPANHFLPNLPACTFPTTRCAVPNAAISQLAWQGFSRASNRNGYNNSTVPQVVPVASVGTVY